ncbi:MAG TPA: ABC transporter substrate-binding protein, partial [Spirochaetia bacterium]|nr:ABC transporter substrate-binding protein [Spirochaetia bacterium]
MKKVIVLIMSLMIVGSLAFAGGSKEATSGSSSAASNTSMSTSSSTLGPTNSNPLSDPRVRQAIDYAIDKKAIVDNLFQGKAIAANSLVPNGAWKTPGLNDYAYDPAKAKQLLKEANWDPNRVLDVVYYYGDQQTVDLMSAIQSYLAAVGIKMTFHKLEGDVASQLYTPPKDPLNGPSTSKWDLAYGAIAALSLHEYYDRMLPGPPNSFVPKNDKLISLINATHAMDIEAQRKAFFALEKYTNEQLPIIPLYYQQVYVAQNKDLNRAGAAYGNPQFNYDWNIINWTIPPNASGKTVLRTNGGPVSFFEAPYLNPGLYMSTRVLFDHLVVADGDLASFKPQLASKYTVSPDGKTISFTLRDGIKWQDGSDITPQDVKWSYEYDSKIPSANALLMTMFKGLEGYQAFKDGSADNISGIEINGRTVTFKFATPDPDALLMFSQFPPLPEKYFKDVSPLKAQQAPYWQHPIGSGPYMIKDVSMGNYATFVPFKQYWGGVAKIDEIQMYPSTESDPNLVKN